ncbi:MAG TPA: preprotein translocase subunit SecG [Steroidobacteraceae bacterium]
MNWLQTLAVVFHVLIAAGIVGLVLLQRGKGADAGAGFGAGASGTVFGARGSASFLSRTTAVLATLFFLSSLGLSYLFSERKEPTSVVDRVLPAPAQTPMLPPLTQMPAAPATQAPAAGAPATAPVPAPAPTAGTAPATPPATGQK